MTGARRAGEAILAREVSTNARGVFLTRTAVACGAVGVGLLALSASEAGSSTPFDGKWLIDATSTGALCPLHSKRMGALIASGKVAKMVGLPSPKAVGFVDSSGAITIEINSFGVTAHVKGRLDGKSGQGEWSSNSMLCPNGVWRAAALQGGQAPAPAKPAPVKVSASAKPTPLAASPVSSPIY
jgi:hypothetical protein